MLARTGNGEALAVEQVFDLDDHFHIATAVVPLSGAAFDGMQLRVFAFPETQDVRGQPAQAGNFTDPEIELVRNQDVFRRLLLEAQAFLGQSLLRPGLLSDGRFFRACPVGSRRLGGNFFVLHRHEGSYSRCSTLPGPAATPRKFHLYKVSSLQRSAPKIRPN